MLYKEMFSFFEKNYSSKSIEETDIKQFQTVFNKTNVISILEDILTNPPLIQKICNRSYTHALGFDKIILVDASKDIEGHKNKNQVRLHIWEPESDALPIVESLHEHSFDFISTVLSGHLENQRFEIKPLSILDKELLEKVRNLTDTAWLNEQIEMLEAYKLKSLGSNQFEDLKMSKKLDVPGIQSLLKLTHEEVLNLTVLEGHYVSDRVAGEKKAYKHVLKEYISLKAKDVLHIDAGEYYFHPYTLAHRLYYDNKILNSTILVTTHVENNPEGGSLQRPSYVQGSEQNYDKVSFTYNSFKLKLENYIKFLKSF